MSQELLTIGVAAVSGITGSVLTYLATRAQLQYSARKDRRDTARQLEVAEYDYLVKIQDMLVDSAQRLVAAQADHTQREIALEREKYKAEEELRYAQAQYKQAVQMSDTLSMDQDLEIRKCAAEKEALEIEVRRLSKLLIQHSIPIEERPLRP